MVAVPASNGGDLGHGPEAAASAGRGEKPGKRRVCTCARLIRFGLVLVDFFRFFVWGFTIFQDP
jgi:hypothetical protein